MALKRNTLWLQAAWYVGVSLAIFIGEVITIYALIVDGSLGDVFRDGFVSSPAWLFFIAFAGIIINLVILLLPFAAITRMRIFASGRSPQGSIAATLQPDPTMALRDGETIILERRRTGRSIAIGTIAFPLMFILIVVACEIGIFAALPAFGRSALNPLYNALLDSSTSPPPTPSVIDWFAAAFPLVLFGVPALNFPILTLRSRRERIMADDRGITAGRKFIPWNDIQLFLRGYSRDVDFTSGYWVWGRQHGLFFTIHPRRTVTIESSRQTQPHEEYAFTNGYEAYDRDAKRLLATIVARSYQPLRMSLYGSRALAGLQRRFPEQAATAPQAEAAPLAAREWQPPTNPTITNFDVRLQPRIAVGRQMLWTVVTTAILFGVFFLFGLFKPPAYSTGEGTGSVYFWATVGVALAISIPVAAVLAFVVQRGRRPVIAADAKGVTKQTLSSSTTVTIPWPEVRAWGMVPPRIGTNDAPRYFVFGETGKLSWAEPADALLGGRVQGERRAAYTQRAAELHALIYARTGLPLHDLTAVIAPTAQSVTDISAIRTSDVLGS